MIEERLDWGVIRCWKMASLCRRVYCGDSAGASIRKGRQSWKKAGKKLEESWKKAGSWRHSWKKSWKKAESG